jgi:hypothetical protein
MVRILIVRWFSSIDLYLLFCGGQALTFSNENFAVVRPRKSKVDTVPLEKISEPIKNQELRSTKESE